MYEYQARVVAVVDGDTLDLEIDLGFGVSVKERVRLAGINCPEKNTVEGAAALTATAQWITDHKAWTEPLKVVTFPSKRGDKKEKWGRYLADLIVPGNGPAREMILNEYLVAQGKAVPYEE